MSLSLKLVSNGTRVFLLYTELSVTSLYSLFVFLSKFPFVHSKKQTLNFSSHCPSLGLG